jgi:hypothetical protein
MQVADSPVRDLSMKMEEGGGFKGRSSKQEMPKPLTAAPGLETTYISNVVGTEMSDGPGPPDQTLM